MKGALGRAHEWISIAMDIAAVLDNLAPRWMSSGIAEWGASAAQVMAVFKNCVGPTVQPRISSVSGPWTELAKGVRPLQDHP